jgi:ribonuclease P protein component
MIGRLLHKRDFERVLANPPCARSAHFALHHLHARPSTPKEASGGPKFGELCTGYSVITEDPVDNKTPTSWLGSVIPKRHARSAVTRNLLRRQIRAALQRHEADLGPGLWLVRLRQPFAAKTYVSAGSRALRTAAASELDQLLIHADR